jgi:hypothetical protein
MTRKTLILDFSAIAAASGSNGEQNILREIAVGAYLPLIEAYSKSSRLEFTGAVMNSFVERLSVPFNSDLLPVMDALSNTDIVGSPPRLIRYGNLREAGYIKHGLEQSVACDSEGNIVVTFDVSEPA